MDMIRPFDPGINETFLQANATSSAGGTLPEDANTVALYNTSATATAYFVCTPTTGGVTPIAAVVPTGGAQGSFPIPPGQMVRITVPAGPKAYRTIASAADGNLLITAGRGN
jgi:hypothetical protein